jgi:hypothetical protein
MARARGNVSVWQTFRLSKRGNEPVVRRRASDLTAIEAVDSRDFTSKCILGIMSRDGDAD